MMGRKVLLAASAFAWALTTGCGGDDGPTNPGGPGSPTASITSPANGSTYTVGQRVDLAGQANDAEDGVLSGGALSWSSNRDGNIGQGTSVDFHPVTAGSHTITLTATDTDGNTGVSSISITVQEVPVLPPVPPATILLEDDMDDENNGNATTNYSSFENWNVVRQCVDLHGPGSVDPMPGNGLYIDMDGSCGSAGMLSSKQTFSFEPGTYRLEMVIGGNNQRGPTDSMTITVGTLFSQTITVAEDEPFQIRSFTINVGAAATGKIELDHAGADQQGILIDAIRLRRG